MKARAVSITQLTGFNLLPVGRTGCRADRPRVACGPRATRRSNAVSTIELVTEIPGPRSREIIARKERVVCDPLELHVNAVIDHALGAAVTDVDGNRLLDLSGGLGCHLVGYSHPKVVEAVKRQAERFSHTDFSVIPYEPYVELAERLVARVGGDRKVALFNAGAEAVENAVKFARAATGRPAIVCFEGAFHGRTLLTMTLTSRHHPYKAGFGPFAPEVYRVPFSYPYRSPDPERAGQVALEALDRAFTTVVDPGSVAAIIVEPVQGEGGFVVPTPDFLPGVAAIAK
ncbi:MAG: aminotransferase class III-fold pyridoxal phosphate-dependent enzyme, partial [Actinobacteria bacterium]|nr:aminotransferase class III-fold pyridoxal phosphate-dependent enzyme [Actinomycetota bacterium]